MILNPAQFFFETFVVRNDEIRPLMDMQFLSPDLGFEVPEVFALNQKLDRVVGEAHTAVRGWCIGLRDGSPYTIDRCRVLGLAITKVIYYRKKDTSKNLVKLHVAVNELEALEKEYREKGNRLPYE